MATRSSERVEGASAAASPVRVHERCESSEHTNEKKRCTHFSSRCLLRSYVLRFGSGFYRNDARHCVVGLAGTRSSIFRFDSTIQCSYMHSRSGARLGPLRTCLPAPVYLFTCALHFEVGDGRTDWDDSLRIPPTESNLSARHSSRCRLVAKYNPPCTHTVRMYVRTETLD